MRSETIKAGYHKLIAWQKSHELALMVYQTTKTFPKDELFAITSQLRRAALSVPTNMVEGYARNSQKEFARFLLISLGSLAEVGYLIEFSYELNYIKIDDYEKVMHLKEEVGQITWKLYNSLK